MTILLGALLDGVNVVSLALVVGVTVGLARASLIDMLTLAIAALSLAVLLRIKINSTCGSSLVAR